LFKKLAARDWRPEAGQNERPQEALRLDRITAPWIIDGPINGELFTIYATEVLAPTPAKGDIVILDNLGSHKGKAARNAIRLPATAALDPSQKPVVVGASYRLFKSTD
jgi:hypothetical protein